jgi:two-component system, OmpR family, alkaline phosphatase synthesis response regulator PhoP
MKKILVADDERVLRMLIAGTLKLGGFEVIEVDNGIDAIKMADMKKPDLVILDVIMPGMTGYEVCRYIKSNTYLKETKVLILTAKDQQPEGEVTADYHMSKPFSPPELLDAVENMLDA